ncbi:MAG: tryptophan--tRNA ligase [Bacilli bacterium]
MKRIVSGIQPSGNLTLGNYIGALKQFINFQNEYEMFIFVADLHAITVNQDKNLKHRIRSLLALYLACGLDPEKNTIFVQSDNPYHTQLSWILECHTYIGELSRMTQFKDKSQNQKQESISTALFTYPVLMASDIIIYDAYAVPVGDDQKQHVEITRDIAERMNKKYGGLFKIPIPIIPKVGARIKNLQDPLKKMSKSAPEDDKGTIFLLDDVNLIRKKIMSAVTDSDNKIKYDENNKAGITNLIDIYVSLTSESIDMVEEKFKNSNYGEFKKKVADVVVGTIEPIQQKYHEILESDIIDETLTKGIAKVIPLAKEKFKIVQERIGLGL